MISEQSKTLAFLARRVGALEKKVETLEDTQSKLISILEQVIDNQDEFRSSINKLRALIARVDAHMMKTEAAWEKTLA